eukprot:gene714-1178_t
MAAATVVKKLSPPSRLEGGGFTIKDLLSGAPNDYIDPFLMWHELPRSYHKPGQMPGAPMHCHRGFNEVPYCKEISGGNSEQYGHMKMRDHAGKQDLMRPGDFQWGKVGCGIEHEALIDGRWEGYLHFFQLWVNLPKAHKMDAPFFQDAAAAALPVVTLAQNPLVTAKVLVGGLQGKDSPVQPCHVSVEYLDYTLEGGARIKHQAPPEMTTKLLYIYKGSGSIGNPPISAKMGELLILSSESLVEIEAGSDGICFMLATGRYASSLHFAPGVALSAPAAVLFKDCILFT